MFEIPEFFVVVVHVFAGLVEKQYSVHICIGTRE